MFLLKYIYKSILHCACLSGNVVLVKYVLSLDGFDNDLTSIFIEIIYEISIRKLFYSVFKMFNYLKCLLYFFYKTILHYAVLSENIALIKYLLSLGKLDINYKDILIY